MRNGLTRQPSFNTFKGIGPPFVAVNRLVQTEFEEDCQLSINQVPRTTQEHVRRTSGANATELSRGYREASDGTITSICRLSQLACRRAAADTGTSTFLVAQRVDRELQLLKLIGRSLLLLLLSQSPKAVASSRRRLSSVLRSTPNSW